MRSLSVLGLFLLVNGVFAEDTMVIELKIKNHKFDKEVLSVPANVKFKIKVTNEDANSEEFESRAMVVEKFIGPKKSMTITLGPLKPGSYDYFGDFHPSTAKGTLTAK